MRTKPIKIKLVKKEDICTYSPNCTGCQLWHLSYSEELQHKELELKNKLKNLIPSDVKVDILNTGVISQRKRFDFTYKNGNLGLYDQERNIIDINNCLILDPNLNQAFQGLRDIFKKIPPPFKVASFRIRIGPDLKTLGLWIDMANVDIKALLIEREFLNQLSKKFIIEIGQKRKRLLLTDSGQHKLLDPKPEIWFKTLDTPLYSFIGSFTQPSWESADLLTQTILSWISNSKPFITEYGCGIGQYSIPLLNKGYALNIFEKDQSAIECLKMNTQKPFTLNQVPSVDIALVNPPRSGLKEFCLKLIEGKPESIIYISCSVDSLKEDLEKLSKVYKVEKINLIDQFPRSRHFETAILLKRI